MNGERFAVMAGTGFDAILMGSVDGAQKEGAPWPRGLFPQRSPGGERVHGGAVVASFGHVVVRGATASTRLSPSTVAGMGLVMTPTCPLRPTQHPIRLQPVPQQARSDLPQQARSCSLHVATCPVDFRLEGRVRPHDPSPLSWVMRARGYDGRTRPRYSNPRTSFLRDRELTGRARPRYPNPLSRAPRTRGCDGRARPHYPRPLFFLLRHRGSSGRAHPN